MSTSEMSFGSLVKQYIESHELSYQDLVEQLGYRSKTSVARIIQDTTSFALRNQFFKLFADHFPLTSKELENFQTALRVSRLDEYQQSLYFAYKHLFSLSGASLSENTYIHCSCKDHEDSFEALLKNHSHNAYKVTVLLFGLCSPSILQMLYNALDDLSCSFSIRHYLFQSDSACYYTKILVAAVPFLFDSRYSLCVCEHSGSVALMESQFLLHYDREDGSESDDLFMQTGKGDLFFQSLPDSSLFQCYSSFLERGCMQFRDLKVHLLLRNDQPCIEAFLLLQKQMLEFEEGRALFCYRKDLSLEFISPEIYKNALQLSYFQSKSALSVRNELVALQRQRFENLSSKRSPSHYIMSQESLKNFILTGRLKNHPFILRPFSPKERAAILHDLLQLMNSNPFFFLRFASNDIPPLWNTISFLGYQHMKRASSHKEVHEDTLLLLPAAQTSEEYVSLMFPDPDIVSTYVSFYQDELWEKHTLSSKRSIHILHLMLQYQAAKFSD